MLPPLDMNLQHGDQILLVGPKKVEHRMAWVTGNTNALHDAVTTYNPQTRTVMSSSE